MQRTLAAALLSVTTLLVGCHSHYIQATVVNHSPAVINVLQVEYPGAAFGTQAIPAGGTFRYRFKLLGSGDLKIAWTDASQKDHTMQSLHLNEGQEGTLLLDFPSQTAVNVTPSLKP